MKQPNEIIRTARKKKLQDFLAVLFFFLLLPYTCSLFLPDYRETAAAPGQGLEVEIKTGAGELKIPAETYLLGTLAASISGDSPSELLKAQAIVLRTLCYYEAEKTGSQSVEAEKIGQQYLTEKERQKLWQENFSEYEEKMKKAVQETAGIILIYENKVIEPAYFRVSAGSTRIGSEVYQSEEYPWFQKVECTEDLECEEYLQEYTIKGEDFLEIMEKNTDQTEGASLKFIRDSSGYVTTAVWNGEEMEGEKFRHLFDLPSAHFQLKQEEEHLIFVTKGVGHGLGLDQYAAGRMAQNGQDYRAILSRFFANCSLEKNTG